MKIVERTTRPLFKIHFHPMNLELRKGQELDAHITGLAGSIKARGYDISQPLVIGYITGHKDSETLISGHCRTAAIQQLAVGDPNSWSKYEIPCELREYANENEMIRDMLALNAVYVLSAGFGTSW